MALTERTEIDERKIFANGTIEARTALIIERDGVEVSRTFVNRQVFVPGADVSQADESVQRLAAIEHTPDRVAAYLAKQAERKARQAKK